MIFFSPGCKRKAQRNGAGQFFAVAYPGGIAVCKPSVLRKGHPDRLAVSLGEKGRLVGDLDARAFERGNRKLAVPLVQRSAIPATIEDDAFHGAGDPPLH